MRLTNEEYATTWPRTDDNPRRRGRSGPLLRIGLATAQRAWDLYREHDFTQAEIASHLDISQPSVSSIVRGERPEGPPAELLEPFKLAPHVQKPGIVVSTRQPVIEPDPDA